MDNRKLPQERYRAKLEALEKIREETEDKKNPYQLNDSEKEDLRIVLNTLQFIVEKIDDLTARQGKSRTVYFPERPGCAPIHLEAFHPGEEGEREMIGSLVDPFITSFETVKKNHTYHVKQFISKLNGNCIDIRTREAFTYALTLGKNPTFTDYLKRAYDEKTIKQHSLDISYWKVFNSIIASSWGKPYTKDSTDSGYAKQDGTFDKTTFPLIARFLQDLSLSPDDSFLFLEPSDYNSTLIQFIVWHQDFFDKVTPAPFLLLHNNLLTENPNYQSEKPSLLNYAYNHFVTGLPQKVTTTADFAHRLNLLNRVDTKEFFISCEKLIASDHITSETAYLWLQHFIKRIEYTKRTDAALYNWICQNNFTLRVVARWDDVDSLSQLHELKYFNEKQVNEIIPTVFDFQSWKVASFLLTHFTLEPARLKQGIFFLCESKEFTLAKQFIEHDSGNDYFYQDGKCALHYAIYENNLEIATILLDKYGDSKKLTVLISALGCEYTKVDTIKWIIEQSKINIQATREALGKCAANDPKKLALLDKPDICIRLIKELLQSKEKNFLIKEMSLLYQQHPEAFELADLMLDVTDCAYLANIAYHFIENNIAYILLRKDESLLQYFYQLASPIFSEEIQKLCPEMKSWVSHTKPMISANFSACFWPISPPSKKRKMDSSPLDVPEPPHKKTKLEEKCP